MGAETQLRLPDERNRSFQGGGGGGGVEEPDYLFLREGWSGEAPWGR